MRLRQICKSGNISIVDPSHIALRVNLHVSILNASTIDEAFPSGSSLVGISFRLFIVAFQLEDLIDRVGLTHDGVIDGDLAAVVIGAAGCKCADAQRQDDRQRQHEGERAFYCFHCLVLPFAFCFFTFIQL